MQILNQHQIQQKLQRLAIEILERNHREPEIILAGINSNGMRFAQMLGNELRNKSAIPVRLTRIRLSPANPLEKEVVIEMPMDELHDKSIIIVDDVANTGRTLFYAIKPLLSILPKKVEIAVLVDRTHKAFPVQADYVGLSLATTLKEHIEVRISEEAEMSVYLT
jgi:pyrimidine operon attenuation protein/uracil phosphoribosyltransferase